MIKLIKIGLTQMKNPWIWYSWVKGVIGGFLLGWWLM